MSTESTCEICSQEISADERRAKGDEVAHAACVRDWFRRNFGRDGLS